MKPKEPPPPPPEPLASQGSGPRPRRPGSEEFILHKVLAGETLATIAKWYSGKPTAWKKIAPHNPGVQPFRLKAGQQIKVPKSLAVVSPGAARFFNGHRAAGRQKNPKEPETSDGSTPPLPVRYSGPNSPGHQTLGRTLMTQFRPIAVLGAGILFVFLTSGAKTAQQAISLEFKPNAKLKASPASVPTVRIFFGEFKDERADPRQVGENMEDKAKRVVIATEVRRASGHFVRTALTDEFRKKGFRLVDQPGQADKIIAGTVLKFWTVETSRYNTETQVKVEVRDPSGGVTLDRLLTGTGKNLGRSLSETNYNESFSDSLVSIVEALYPGPGFMRPLVKDRLRPGRPHPPLPPVLRNLPPLK